MQLLVSPWAEAFDNFGRSIHHQALLVAPYIARGPLERLSAALSQNNRPKVDILTNLPVDNMLQGSIDVKAIALFCRENPSTTVRHLPGLHAKAYVADDHLAIVTSGNLTGSSLNRNYEYGIQITDSGLFRQIYQDLRDYGILGSEVSTAELEQIAEISETLRTKYDETVGAARVEVRRDFERQLEVAKESLRHVRARPGESTHAIFARTILYILRNGPLTTQQINLAVEGTHPDLCDNSVDRVINGVHFGRKWKHMVRTSQVFLRRKGLIELYDNKWQLTENVNLYP
jgi:phosphatidylserine/phosphatidylglycerophosphate/cardiolipin synthase-like enzyme